MFQVYCQLFHSINNDIIIVGCIINNSNNKILKRIIGIIIMLGCMYCYLSCFKISTYLVYIVVTCTDIFKKF